MRQIVLIQDIIDFIDMENEEGIITFLDQQKYFDRIEWGWVQAYLLKKIKSWVTILCMD
jgi:Ni,Fe-hydrogenase maturation factor